MFDDSFTDRLFQLESSNDPMARTGSNRGLGQFSPDLERKYGIKDWTDRDQQKAAVQREMDEFAPVLSKSLGRDPTPGEGYLAHQQGLSGALAHLNNPSGTAWHNVRQYYPSDRVAKDAIWGNIPDNAKISPNFHKGMFPGGVDSVTSGDFGNGWIGKFEGSPALSSGSVASVVPAGAVANGSSASVGGLLAGTDVSSPQGQGVPGGDMAASLGRIAQLFNQNNQMPAAPAPPPIQYPVPAALRARVRQMMG